MARHSSRTGTIEDKKQEHVESLSNSPLEDDPEKGPTKALGQVMKPAVHTGEAKALSQEKPSPELEYYRVEEDRHIAGAGGFRSKLKAGKEIDSGQYNIKKLRSQGVKLTRISAEDRAG